MTSRLAKMLIDIGANLTDGMYQGVYHGTKRHEPDLSRVLSRAWEAGLKHIMVTGGSLEESRQALELAQRDARLSCTVGCHPTRCKAFEESGDPEKYLTDLEELIKSGGKKVSAFGEFGLDYDRLQFCDKDTQIKYLKRQLEVANRVGLPMFLHCRNSAADLFSILSEQPQPLRGVVHSFDGSLEEAQNFIKLGLHIGINGCSLRTSENLEVVRLLPLERLLLETDSPWCDVRPSHAGAKLIKSKPLPSCKKEKWNPDAMVKSRNEPCMLGQVLEIVSGIRSQKPEEVELQIYKNTTALFTTISSDN